MGAVVNKRTIEPARSTEKPESLEEVITWACGHAPQSKEARQYRANMNEDHARAFASTHVCPCCYRRLRRKANSNNEARRMVARICEANSV